MNSDLPDNFGGLPEEFSNFESSAVAVLPVPFDMTSSWLIGSDKGPQALIDASKHMELYDIETRSEMYKRGIYTAPAIAAGSSSAMIKQTYAESKRLLEAGKFVVTLGGEHAISAAPIKAHAEKYGPLTILQFDAHTDLRDSYEGDKLSHASAMARSVECSGVERLVSVGIRAIDSSELGAIKPENTFFAEDIAGQQGWQERVLARLGERVYVTFDLDVFEPGLMPSTGTPEPGGLGWYEVLKLLRMVAAERTLVGFDVVELMPSETNRAPDFVACKLVYKMLSYKFA
ncbi:MAG: agmatinase [Oligoflexia bacterium]|nr:agmatinase [Oligoflexia bacterium]